MKLVITWKGLKTWGLSAALLLTATTAWAADADKAFSIGKKTVSVADLAKDEQSAFFEVEKQRYELIERLAQGKYLEHYFSEKAKKDKQSIEQARANYIKANVKITDKEVKDTIEKFKEYPQLKKLSKADQEVQIRAFLEQSKEQELMSGIISSAIAKKDLQVLYPKPQEPVFDIVVNKNDPVRYGPKDSDIKPLGCDGDKCPITVVEYSEYQCPFCVRVLPTVKRLLTEYKGKARWIVRDFPLSFHDRAKPAAIAARCAMQQGKYWEMYSELFANQGDLTDQTFEKHAKSIGTDVSKWKKCYAEPGEIKAQIDQNFQTGQQYGVTGTPAYFINGRRISGAQPYEKFKEMFDEELSSKRKS